MARFDREMLKAAFEGFALGAVMAVILFLLTRSC